MKFRILKIGISSVLFIAIVFVSLVLIRPAIMRFEQSLVQFRDSLLLQVEEKTGLRISYTSISPSILSAFRIKGIVVSDALADAPLLEIDKAVLTYHFGDFFSGNFLTAFKKLVVSGIALEFNAFSNEPLVEKFMQMADSSSSSGSPSDTDINTMEKLEKMNLSFPFDVEIRDVSVHYQDEKIDALLKLNEVAFQQAMDNSFTDVLINGRVSVVLMPSVLEKIPEGFSEGLKSVSGNFFANASLSKNLDGSTARLRLSSVKTDNYSLSRISLLAQYDKGRFRATTMQDRLPFSLMAEFDINSKHLAVQAELDGLDPFALVSVSQGPELLDKIRGSTFSGNYVFNSDLTDSYISYSADGFINLSPNLLPGETLVSYNVQGDSSDIVIQNLSVVSDITDVFVEGSFNIPNMRLAGTAFLEKLVVPGGGTISAEMYVDPLEAGFVCFVPQIYLDERSFTALQLTVIPDQTSNSVDFDFEVSDYSHVEFGEPGVISVAGSLIGGTSPFAQAQISINDFFVDTVVETLAFFLPEKKDSLKNLSDTLSPVMMSNELYVSTDFSSVTYNVPYWIMADTKQDKGLLVFSFTGNESTVNLSQFDLLYGSHSVHLAADVGLDYDFGSAFFTADATVNSIPYSFAGSFMPEIGLTVTGSYGLSATLSLSSTEEGTLLDGILGLHEFPVALGKAVFACSTDIEAQIPFYDFSSFFVDIKNLSVSEVAGAVSFEPTLTLSGKVNNFGLMLETFVYSDTVSLLNGAGGMMWSFSEGILESASLNLSLLSSVSSESYTVSATISNPEFLPFSTSALMKDFYFSAQVDVVSFPMARVRQMQGDGDVCTASITAMGTAENPYVAVTLEPSSVSFSGVPFSFRGAALLDDGVIYLNDSEIRFGKHAVSGIAGQFSLPDFAGEIAATYDGALSTLYTIHAPINIKITSSANSEDSGISGLMNALSQGVPEFVSAEIDTSLSGTLFDQEQPVSLDIVRLPGYIAVTSDDDLGISGTVTEEGNINFKLEKRMPIHGDFHGSIVNQTLDIKAMDIYSDLSRFQHLLYFPQVALYGGILTGNASISGILADPDFNGAFNIENLDLNCPNYVPEHIVGAVVPVTMRENELKIDGVPFKVGYGSVVMDLSLTLDRWKLGLLTLDIKTPRNVLIPAQINAPPMWIDGMSTCDLNIAVTLNSCDIVGKFFTENVDIEILTNLAESAALLKKEGFAVTLDIDVTTGQHVEIAFNPLLRGLIEPNTNLKFLFDSTTKDFIVKSDIKLRGGEITYLNRNFYLREGQVVLDERGSSFDPRITVRAEIRERDEDGEPVRITLAAEKQKLSEFNPSYTSSPARSELEIMAMLGQAAAGDIQDGWDVLLTGVDYGFQVFVLRKLENALRDLLNFDIFSLRTMGLQNSLRQWLDASAESKPLTISNFLDNTTVYIGKYFGSSIYADALFHFAYDETKIASGESVSGLMFQPEIGLEMDSPFATIRWSLAPEIGTTQHLWVPATSITLSWKFVF